MSRVLILGGYGNFGKRIARLLTRHNIAVIVAGRDADKAKLLARTLPRVSPKLPSSTSRKPFPRNSRLYHRPLS
jgi:prephenate dehydrogenase